MMARWFESLQRLPVLAHLLALLFSLLAGYGVSRSYTQSEQEHYRFQVEAMAKREAAKLESVTLHGEVMGMARLLGFNEPLIIQLVNGQRKVNDPEVLARLKPVQQTLQAEAILVINADGVVIGQTGEAPMQTGQNVSDKPYWQLAVTGISNVYPAVESSNSQRVIYHTVPIWGAGSIGGKVLGALVVRMPALHIDEGLGNLGRPALLLSPTGLVFAATDKSWLFKFDQGSTMAERDSTSELGQFGPLSEDGQNHRMLPFDLSQSELDVNGQHYFRVRSTLQWKDPHGRWYLMVLGEADDALPLWARMLLLAVVAGTLYLLFVLIWRAALDMSARREALARSEDASRQLGLSARRAAQLSAMTLQLQDARTLEALAHTFFQQIDALVPVHQGTLYFLEATGSSEPAGILRLAGGYGTAAAPETLALGEGLLGQCALDKRSMRIHEVPQDFWRIATGTSETTPCALLLLPITKQSELLGVLEIASLGMELTDNQDMVESLLPVLGMNLEILLAERRLGKLLEDARQIAQNYRLQQQHSQAIEDWYQAVLLGAPDGILVVDETGAIVLANRVAATMFGYDDKEMIGLNVDRLVPAAARNEHAGLRQAFSAGGTQQLKSSGWRAGLQGLRKDGREISLAISLASIPATELRGPCICAVIASRQSPH